MAQVPATRGHMEPTGPEVSIISQGNASHEGYIPETRKEEGIS
jgi:hypothetical protein